MSANVKPETRAGQGGTMKLLSGKMLVATPQLRDPNFAQTVLLMIQHETQGAFGLILNRPGDKTVDEVWGLLGKDLCDCQQTVYMGGPVPGPLIALHTVESLSDQEVLPGLYATAQATAFDEMLHSEREDEFRIYSGHAGWGGGQLEDELKLGGWLTCEAKVEDVFSDHESLWRDVTSRIGLKILAPGLRPEQVPKDPGLN
jgi:putative transcriptional regulator